MTGAFASAASTPKGAGTVKPLQRCNTLSATQIEGQRRATSSAAADVRAPAEADERRAIAKSIAQKAADSGGGGSGGGSGGGGGGASVEEVAAAVDARLDAALAAFDARQAMALEQLERAVDAAVEQRMSALTAKLDGLQAAIAELPSTLLLSLPESGRKEGGGEGH